MFKLSTLYLSFLFLLIFSVESAFSRTGKPTANICSTTVKPTSAEQIASDTSKEKEPYYFELKAIVKQSKGDEKDEMSTPLDSVQINLYSEDILISKLWTNKKGKCTIRMPLNKNLKVEVAKKGFVSKSIAINTKIPENKKDAFRFNCEVMIFEEIKGLDVTILNSPIAKINYSASLDGFRYDVNYTNKINGELMNLYKKYYELQKSMKDSLLMDKQAPQKKLPVNEK